MRSTQMTGIFWRVFVGVGLMLAVFAYGCGRTSLDDGFGDAGSSGSAGATGTAGATGSGGQAGTGAGGKGAGGQGGIGVGTPLACGNTFCSAGKQSCCNQVVNMKLVASCVSASDPTACPNGVISCAASVACTTTFPNCCLVANVPICLPAGLPCMPPGP